MENLNLKFENINQKEIVVREGKAPEIKEPNLIDIKGDIKTISSFVNGRIDVIPNGNKQGINKEKTIVIVDRDNFKILLFNDPESYYGAKLEAALLISDQLKEFQINTTTTFSQSELVKKLRFNKIAFENKDKHALLLAAYQSFKASSHVEVESSKDNRGNKVTNFDRKITTGLPEEFILNIPIFKGEDAKTFRVEICLDMTDGSTRFWFESAELHELMKIEADRIFDQELKVCKEAGLLIINK